MICLLRCILFVDDIGTKDLHYSIVRYQMWPNTCYIHLRIDFLLMSRLSTSIWCSICCEYSTNENLSIWWITLYMTFWSYESKLSVMYNLRNKVLILKVFTKKLVYKRSLFNRFNICLYRIIDKCTKKLKSVW